MSTGYTSVERHNKDKNRRSDHLFYLSNHETLRFLAQFLVNLKNPTHSPFNRERVG